MKSARERAEELVDTVLLYSRTRGRGKAVEAAEGVLAAHARDTLDAAGRRLMAEIRGRAASGEET